MTKEPMTYSIIGAAMEVHRQLGCGFSEKVYQEALEEEFVARGIPYEREKRMQVVYKGKVLSMEFVPDFVCYGRIIVELKAVQELVGLHEAQAINYARVGNMEVALLLNFGAESLEYERLFNPNYKNRFVEFV
ncbi:MAG: GxxExxY protein [Bacteroidaceae bacterium]|nr:GxxExxY protein [Bacteroidaceae bacterium]